MEVNCRKVNKRFLMTMIESSWRAFEGSLSSCRRLLGVELDLADIKLAEYVGSTIFGGG